MDRSILRIIISFFISIVALPVMGQIISSQAVAEQSTPNGAQIFIYNTIQNISLRHESTEPVSYEWFKYNPSDNSWNQARPTQNGSATTLVISEPGGYELKITNNLNQEIFYKCWAFEEPSISIEVVEEDCYNLSLQANFNPTALIYYNSNGTTGNAIDLMTFDWSATPFVDSIPSNALVSIPAPLEDTKYGVSISSSGTISTIFDYTAIAVKADYRDNQQTTKEPQ